MESDGQDVAAGSAKVPQSVKIGIFHEEHPLDTSDEFNELMLASRRGDLKTCQELISGGVNLNGRDKFDYTPLIIASLCGHYELVELLLDSGALAERNTFQGERCIYNALNDRIRNLLLEYDFSKTTDPLQAWSSHISSLQYREFPKTTDFIVVARAESYPLHRFILSSRSPYFQRLLSKNPTLESWPLPSSIPVEAFQVVARYLYLGQIPSDLFIEPRSSRTEDEVKAGIAELSKLLEIEGLGQTIESLRNRRLARQMYQDGALRAQAQIDQFFDVSVIGGKQVVESSTVQDVKWDRGNQAFADCILAAHELPEGEKDTQHSAVDSADEAPSRQAYQPPGSVPFTPTKSVLYPVHKAVLLRSPYFETMFSSKFFEAQEMTHLHTITVDCTPEVLEILLRSLYTDLLTCPLDLALDLLYMADMFFLDALKVRAAKLISTLGSGTTNVLIDRTHLRPAPNSNNSAITEPEALDPTESEEEPINVYDIINAAWDLRVQSLEEFAARYIAYRLEDYIDEEDFAALIEKSASRLESRQETDTIELLDDIRYYLSERFRLRFDVDGIQEMWREPEPTTAAAQEDGAEEEQSDESDEKPIATPIPTEDKGPAQLNSVRALDGRIVEDEFSSDAVNYEILLEKIDEILERLKLDA